MTTTNQADHVTEVQATLSRAALALDSFLVNGIPMGIVYQTGSDDLLARLADKFFRALSTVPSLLPQAPTQAHAMIKERIPQASKAFDRLHENVTRLASFRQLSSQEIHTAVAAIVQARQECRKHLEELEMAFAIPGFLSQTRSLMFQSNVEHFLANLPTLLEAEQTPMPPATENPS